MKDNNMVEGVEGDGGPEEEMSLINDLMKKLDNQPPKGERINREGVGSADRLSDNEEPSTLPDEGKNPSLREALENLQQAAAAGQSHVSEDSLPQVPVVEDQVSKSLPQSIFTRLKSIINSIFYFLTRIFRR